MLPNKVLKFQRRTSKEGLLNEMDGTFEASGSNGGSTDPLLQIPSQLSAVLTLKRGSSPGGRGSRTSQVKSTATPASADSNRTPLLKRKRESIV